MAENITIRSASREDGPRIADLITASAHELGKEDYPGEAIDLALTSGVWGLDTQLLDDRTYYLVLVDGELAACGGWSFRKTLFAKPGNKPRENNRLDPSTDAAKIRAFFVHPQFARRGLGSLLLSTCETAARLAGFRSFELAATLAGERLYRQHGYTGSLRFEYPVGDNLTMPGLHMTKRQHHRIGRISIREERNSTLPTTLDSTSTPQDISQ